MKEPQEPKPRFRPDIRRHAYAERHGGHSIVLEDPVANKFFRISPYEFELLSVLDGTRTVREAIEKLKVRGRYFTRSHAAKLVEQFSRAGLLLGTPYGTARVQTVFKNKMDSELRRRSLFKLYYLYIPLLNPDRFLEKTLHIWRLVVNRFTMALILLLVPGAAYLLVDGADRVHSQFLFFFNVENLLFLWIAIAIVKLVHEFSHAYVAKALGLRVPEMGLAFLIFFPCLYCNTTAAWQLADRNQRMSIALAWIVSELIVAVISVYLWYFSRAGLFNSVTFYLMAVSVISSFLFNGNPLLKFDGYFVLTDWLRMPNLQAKAFSYVRYLFLSGVLGMETVTAPIGTWRDQIVFAVYGFAALVYRIFLVFAIVGGIYLRFDKTIGIMLGLLGFSLLIAWPLSRAARNLVKRRAEVNYQPTGVAAAVCVAAVGLFLLAVPWSSRSVYPCYVESATLREIVIPAEAPVRNVLVRQGDRVANGQTLLRLDGTRLAHSLKIKQIDEMLVKKEIALIESGESDLSRLPLKYIELSQVQDAIQHISQDLQNLEWKAPFAGAVTKLAADVQDGACPGKGAIVGELASQDYLEALALVTEADVGLLRAGTRVEVWFPVDAGRELRAVVREVSPFKTEDLEGLAFSSRFGGEIATETTHDAGKDSPIEPYYACKIDLPANRGIPLGMTGKLIVEQPPRSALRRIVDAVYRTFHREIIF